MVRPITKDGVPMKPKFFAKIDVRLIARVVSLDFISLFNRGKSNPRSAAIASIYPEVGMDLLLINL